MASFPRIDIRTLEEIEGTKIYYSSVPTYPGSLNIKVFYKGKNIVTVTRNFITITNMKKKTEKLRNILNIIAEFFTLNFIITNINNQWNLKHNTKEYPFINTFMILYK